MALQGLVFIFSLLVLASAFDDNTVEDVKETVSQTMDLLPDSIKSVIPKEFSPNEFPSIDEGEELLQKRCEQYGTNESYADAMAAKQEVMECFQNFANYSQIQKEIDRAMPTGDLDTVFPKYCKKSSLLKDCVRNFTEAIQPCLSPEERKSKHTFINILDSLIKFICFKDGDYIALFIAEGGPQCLKSNEEQIQQCLNSTFSHYLPQEMSNTNELPLFTLGDVDCGDINKVQKCIVAHLEKCPDPTPANIMGSMMTFVRKATQCKQVEQRNGASPLTISRLILALSGVLALAPILY